MSNRIPDEKVELVRRSADIVEVISDFVQLKKQGRQYIGLCPFHGEKSPSFSVSPDKQLYHCFGCGAGGNVFSFLMEIESLTFVETVKKLAERLNIDLPEVYAAKEQKVTGPEHTLKQAYKQAAELYHQVLMLTEEGRAGRKYAQSRRFTEAQIEQFQLGFAPDRRSTLTTIFAKQQYPLQLLVQGGLIGHNEDYYDRLRNRFIFPIWDGQGNVIAFGGRALGDEKPKYLNSSDSPIFNKSSTLYGLHIARQKIRKTGTVILFEGYVDVIAAWGAGITNGVATLGTALTEEQARILRRNAGKVVLCYDGDHSGQEAAYRAAALLEGAGLQVLVAELPDQLDPDDYIRQYGAEPFQKNIIEDAQAVMAFKMRYLRKGKDLSHDETRMQYIEKMLSEIATLQRAIEREHYLRQIADEFSLSLETLKQDQYQIYRSQQRQAQRYNKQEQIKVRAVEQKRLLPAFQNAERQLLAYMMRDVTIAEKAEQLIGGHFNVPDYQAIAAHLYAYYSEGNEPNDANFIQRLTDEKLRRVATELALLPLNDKCEEQELNDYIKRIKSYPKWVNILEKEAAAKRDKDPIAAAKYLIEIQKMKRELL